MAGDWIKMRTDLVTDPAVIAIASQLEIEEDAVVGKLHRIWSWADHHTIDGRTNLVGEKWLDKYVQTGGFANAMIAAGWLKIADDTMEFPGFERHMGATAKRRLSQNERAQRSRSGHARVTLPRAFVSAIMRRDAFTCAYCGVNSNEERERWKKACLSIDHIVPESRGGKGNVENLVTCCRNCNKEKNDRTPEEWGIGLSFLQDGIIYTGGQLSGNVSVAQMSQKNVTSPSPEKRRVRDKKKSMQEAVSEPTKPRTRTDRDDLWDAVVAEFALPAETKTQRGRLGRIVADLTAMKASIVDLRAKSALYRANWPGVTCTPEAVLKHWSAFDGKNNATTGRIAADPDKYANVKMHH